MLKLEGLGPDSNFKLFVINYAKRLGGCVKIDATRDELPSQVQLKPLGRLAFRVVDEEGKPYANVRVGGMGADFDPDSTTDENGRYSGLVVVGADVHAYAFIDGKSRLLFSLLEISANQLGDLGDVIPHLESR